MLDENTDNVEHTQVIIKLFRELARDNIDLSIKYLDLIEDDINKMEAAIAVISNTCDRDIIEQISVKIRYSHDKKVLEIFEEQLEQIEIERSLDYNKFMKETFRELCENDKNMKDYLENYIDHGDCN